MNALIILLSIFFLGGIISYFAYKIAKVVGDIVTAIIAVGSAVYFFGVMKEGASLSFSLGGFQLTWSLGGFAWIFAMLVAALAALSMIYSISYMKGRDRLGWFYMLYNFSVGAMFGILMARDWVSLFIFWEIMTWSSYLLVIYDRGKVNPDKAGLKYLVFSAIGAYSMITAIVAIASYTGSLQIADTFRMFGSLTLGAKLLIGLLLLVGFGVKAAIMPLHVWAPDAYSSAPMSYTSVFSGALSKMGIYGIGLVVLNMYLNSGIHIVGNLLAWLGAITALLGTLFAIIQDDAKKLLAWSSVAQLGYIIGGIGLGTKLSVFAGVYLAVLHGAFKATLFMAVGAVERQAGTTKFSELRALVRKMPYTFLSALIAVIALAGIPPLGGFVGKWMLYESMITGGHYVIVILFFAASTAGFLYCYRFLFGIFLGQEEKEYENVKEAPILMVLPMLILALFLVVTGTLPGFVFKPIAQSMKAVGFEGVTYHMSILTNNWGNSVYLKYVTWTLVAVFLIFLVIISWVNHRRTKYVTTKDIHTSGEAPSEEDNYHLTLDFFRPFTRAIDPIYRASVMKIYNTIGKGIEDFMDFARKIYNGNAQTYALYVILLMSVLLIFAKFIF